MDPWFWTFLKLFWSIIWQKKMGRTLFRFKIIKVIIWIIMVVFGRIIKKDKVKISWWRIFALNKFKN